MGSHANQNGSTTPVKPPRKSLFRPKSIQNLLARSKQQTTTVSQMPRKSQNAPKVNLHIGTVTSADVSTKDADRAAPSPTSVPLPPSPLAPNALDTGTSTAQAHATATPDMSSHPKDHHKALRSSLAMLDTQFESLHKLASPRSSRHLNAIALSPASSTDATLPPTHIQERELTTVSEAVDEADTRPKLSPRSSSLPTAAHHIRASSQAKAQQLWNATGLQEQENIEPECAAQVVQDASLNDRQRTDTSSSSNSDSADISEFPSYSDLQAFATNDGVSMARASQIPTSKRNSNLLDFPLPPTVDSAPTLPFEDESDVSTDEMSVPDLLDADNTSDLFAQLNKLAEAEQPRSGTSDGQMRGLGLFDASATTIVTTPELAHDVALASDTDDQQSDKSSHFTHSSHDASTHVSASADTSFSASKDEVTTYQTAFVAPHSFSVLPAALPLYETATAKPDIVRNSLRESPPPTSRAVSSLQPMPEILRTQPTPPVKSAITDMSEERRASFLPGQRLQTSPTPLPHSALPPSPGVEVVSMRPQSMARRPSSTLEPYSPNPSRSPSISPTPSRKSSTDRPASRVRDSSSPAEMYMRPTSALHLEGDFGFPLWDASPSSGSSSKVPDGRGKAKEGPSHPGLPPKSPSQVSAPKSPLAAPPLTAEPASPPPPTLGKRMSFGMLKKRKSEQALAAKSSDQVATDHARSVRRSASTPKLSAVKPSAASSQVKVAPVPASPKSLSSPKANKKRFSLFLPQVFGSSKADVPPVPALTVPLSAPPTTVAFSEAAVVEETKQPQITASVTSSARPSDELEVLHSSAAEIQVPPSPGIDEARMSLRAFIDLSSEKDQVMPRPARSSSFFAASLDSPVFPSASPAPSPTITSAPFGELTNQSELTVASSKRKQKLDDDQGDDDLLDRIASPVLSDEGPYGVQDVIVFPVSTPSLDQGAWHADEESTSSSEDEGADSGEDEGDEQVESETRSSEDDKPLAEIPGALTAQKSLRQASKKSKLKRSSDKRDPFKFDKLVDPVDDRQGRSISLGTTLGHSLLPQTDEAVERRSASLTRSPSAPLDPVVANSALTIDSPDVVLRSLPILSPETAQAVKSRSRDASPARSALTIDSVAAQKHARAAAAPRSPSLTVPVPTSRSASMSSRHHAGSTSAPPSRQASQRRPSGSSSSMQRSRSNTAASNAPSTSSQGHSAALRAMTTASANNSPSGSPRIGAPAPALPTVEHKIFVGDHTKKMRVHVSSATTCSDIVAIAKKQGLLTFGSDNEGGFSLWELCRVLGLERPIREYEFVADVIKSWDHDTNILIIKRTTLWPLLSASLRIQPAVPQSSFVQLQVKKGKWTKRFLQIRDNAVWQAKSEKPKDATVLCQLASFDVFFVASHVIGDLKAPKPFVFALKSKLPRAHYENESEYCHFVSVKTPEELTKWVKAVVEARNPLVRTENAVSAVKAVPSSHAQLFNSAAAVAQSSGNNSPSSTPSLSRNPSLRPKPSILAIPPVPVPSPGGLNSPVLGSGAVDRPDARVWAVMSDQDRQAWLRDAQKEARQEGKTLLDFSAESGSGSAASSMRR
ncbi:hypothetical protein OIV83_000608 [Microbotryomycetes sp. JL201]|nr:hypothetical protein OIV83_000608 [Microbotryomycetes sp. JL201]